MCSQTKPNFVPALLATSSISAMKIKLVGANLFTGSLPCLLTKYSFKIFAVLKALASTAMFKKSDITPGLGAGTLHLELPTQKTKNQMYLCYIFTYKYDPENT